MGFIFPFDFSFCFLVGIVGLLVAFILLIVYLARRILDILAEREWASREYQQQPQYAGFRQQTFYTRMVSRPPVLRVLGYGYWCRKFGRRRRRRGRRW